MTRTIVPLIIVFALIWAYWLTMQGQYGIADLPEPVSYTQIVVRCEPPLKCSAEVTEYWGER